MIDQTDPLTAQSVRYLQRRLREAEEHNTYICKRLAEAERIADAVKTLAGVLRDIT